MPTRSLSSGDITNSSTQYFNSANGHIYEYVSTTVTWSQALTAAAAKSIAGVSGHLVTITSAAEQAFVGPLIKINGSVWIGASDEANEGVWKWIAGPEAGQQFWTGNSSGTSYGGQYSNWYLGYLDNWASGAVAGADYGALIGTAVTDPNMVGKWDDAPGIDVRGYLIEYSGLVATNYALSTSSSSVNEGSIATFTLTTSNVLAGTVVPYTISGVSADDIVSGTLSGSVVISANGITTIQVSLVNDALTEGNETLTISAGGASATTTVNDSSVAVILPIYNETTGHYYQRIPGGIAWQTALSQAASLSYKGLSGYLATITSASENTTIASLYPTGSLWIGASDSAEEGTWKWVSGPESGSQFWSGASLGKAVGGNYTNWYLPFLDNWGGGNATGADYAMVYGSNLGTDLPVAARSTWGDTTDGESTNGGYVVEYGGMPATYSIIASTTAVNEGGSLTFTVTTTNFEWGKSIPYSISGISATDISSGILSGLLTVSQSDTNGVATLTLNLVEDHVVDGTETLTLSLGGKTSSVTVKDTSVPIATYSLTSLNPSVNEGGTASFSLTTTNVASGTVVSYVLSGISSSDLASGTLNGTTTIDSKGQATISVLLADDNLTENTETLTVTLGSTSASTQINDTSKSAPPTYSVSTSLTSTNEGTSIVATLRTSNVETGTSLYYRIFGSGITTEDFAGLPLTGTSVVDLIGQATINMLISADSVSEGDEIFYIQYYSDSIRTTAAGAPANVTIVDTSNGIATPTYGVTANRPSTNEGSNADFTITTTNVSAGTSIPFTLTGISTSDITGGALSGFAYVNSSGIATVSIPIAADGLTEGSETITLNLQGKSDSVEIFDTSKTVTAPSYNLASTNSSVNEGAIATFTLTTSGVSPGTSIAYTLSGISAADVTGNLSGSAIVDINGIATIAVPISADFLTEGKETLTVSTQGKLASVLINDTSITTLLPSYALSASANSVAEGSNAVFTLTTTNVAGGTAIAYTISGVSSSDITGGNLTGTAIVDLKGVATISIPIASDSTTEGSETLVITAQGISTTVLINDTSLSAPQTVSTQTINGTANNDILNSTTANDAINGGAGLDTVVVNGYASNYVLAQNGTGYTLTDKSGLTGTDTLSNIESIKFSDKTMNLLVQNKAASASPFAVTSLVELYVSFFNRIPDADGMSYWIDELKAGKTINQIAEAFYTAGLSYSDLTGFSSKTTNTDFINVIYKNVLGRPGGADSGGLDYWNSKLASGSATKGTLVTEILKSAHTFKGDPTWGWVANLLDNKIDVAKKFSIDLGLNFNTPEESIKQGMSIASAITANDTKAAFDLISGPSVTLALDTTPQIHLSAASPTVNEGEIAKVYISTTNIPASTALSFSITGVTTYSAASPTQAQWDVSTSLISSIILDANGQATLNIQTNVDNLTEGPETMYITIGNASTSILINDTSITLVGVFNPPIDMGGGGSSGGGD